MPPPFHPIKPWPVSTMESVVHHNYPQIITSRNAMPQLQGSGFGSQNSQHTFDSSSTSANSFSSAADNSDGRSRLAFDSQRSVNTSLSVPSFFPPSGVFNIPPPPAANRPTQSTSETQFRPPPFHMPPPSFVANLPPLPLPSNIPPPSLSSSQSSSVPMASQMPQLFNPQIPPPIPGGLSVIAPQPVISLPPCVPPPTSVSVQGAAHPSFNFHVPPPPVMLNSTSTQHSSFKDQSNVTGANFSQECIQSQPLPHAVTTFQPWSAKGTAGTCSTLELAAMQSKPFAVNQSVISHDLCRQMNFTNTGVCSVSNVSQLNIGLSTDVQTKEPGVMSSSKQDAELSDEKLEQKSDLDWVNGFIMQVKQKPLKTSPLSRPQMTIPQFQSLLREAILLNNQLKDYRQRSHSCVESRDGNGDMKRVESDCNNGSQMPETDNEVCESVQVLEADFSSCALATDRIQARIKEIHSQLCEAFDGIKKRQMKIAKKRKRLQRQRLAIYEAEQEARIKRAKLCEETAKWEHEEQMKLSAIKMEAEMKKAADKTLLEVRKKISDARQSLKLLTQLRKLRQLRKDQAERKGISTRKTDDNSFEERVTALTNTLKQQLELYEAEQRTLQVMLETEQEETKERERIKQKKKEEERLKKYEQQLNDWLFGADESIAPDHPLVPYRQYYDLANYSVEALVNIRREWDAYLVPDGTAGASGIPVSWVTPHEPTDDIWASALNSR